MKEHEHLRCPLCGRLARLQGATPERRLPTMFSADHAIEVRIQSFTGHDRYHDVGVGFVWTERPLRRGEAAALMQVTRKVAARLEDLVDHATEPPTGAKEFATWSDAYLAEAEEALTLAEANLRARRREVERLIRERDGTHG